MANLTNSVYGFSEKDYKDFSITASEILKNYEQMFDTNIDLSIPTEIIYDVEKKDGWTILVDKNWGNSIKDIKKISKEIGADRFIAHVHNAYHYCDTTGKNQWNDDKLFYFLLDDFVPNALNSAIYMAEVMFCND